MQSLLVRYLDIVLESKKYINFSHISFCLASMLPLPCIQFFNLVDFAGYQ